MRFLRLHSGGVDFTAISQDSFLSHSVVCVCLMAALISPGWGEPACRAAVKSNVEVASGSALVVSDLLAPAACPGLAAQAARVSWGRAPLAGSRRVIAGEDVRRMLEKIRGSDPQLREQGLIFDVPERVVVRSAGRRASCSDLSARLTASSSGNARNRGEGVGEATCGAADRVTREAQIETLRKSWDPLLASWNVVARCRRPEECVPFLVRVPGPADSPELVLPTSPLKPKPGLSGPPAALRSSRDLAVRPGQRATLVWEENGLRLEIPVVCLDGGAKGERVRARVGHSGRTLRAIVMESGRLRAIS